MEEEEEDEEWTKETSHDNDDDDERYDFFINDVTWICFLHNFEVGEKRERERESLSPIRWGLSCSWRVLEGVGGWRG